MAAHCTPGTHLYPHVCTVPSCSPELLHHHRPIISDDSQANFSPTHTPLPSFSPYTRIPSLSFSPPHTLLPSPCCSPPHTSSLSAFSSRSISFSLLPPPALFLPLRIENAFASRPYHPPILLTPTWRSWIMVTLATRPNFPKMSCRARSSV